MAPEPSIWLWKTTGSPISWKFKNKNKRNTRFILLLVCLYSLGVVSGRCKWFWVILSDFCDLRCLPVRKNIRLHTAESSVILTKPKNHPNSVLLTSILCKKRHWRVPYPAGGHCCCSPWRRLSNQRASLRNQAWWQSSGRRTLRRAALQNLKSWSLVAEMRNFWRQKRDKSPFRWKGCVVRPSNVAFAENRGE